MQKYWMIPALVFMGALLVACGSQLDGNRMPTDVPGAASRTGTAAVETAASIPPDDCPVTVPQDPPFTPPVPYDKPGSDQSFWFGSNALWTAIPKNGVWSSLPDNPEGYTQKILGWREGYVWTDEPKPDLVVTGERLDDKAPLVRAARATNAYAGDIGSAMLTGVDFPSLGCWRITGNYKGTELSFVVWIAP
jgi:hypothetical protein